MSYADDIKQAFEVSHAVVDKVTHPDAGKTTDTTVAQLETLSHALEQSLLVLSKQIEEVARMR